MSKTKNILLFTMLTNRLKYKIRTVWKDVRVSGRKESEVLWVINKCIKILIVIVLERFN